ncbi:hypothetical protein F53441_12518 [Fusarium austroafricanum]|uniref:G-patch domain-containing protein n=1 Tax=Fusarium austroafricanum TaxID=2364996 RepID=A0A8H4JXN9_9HYPO|nr:hypothetical protein F53441_12518 [Fusarium austroafricanum]
MGAEQKKGVDAPDEEDDYMNMSFDDPTPAKETSLQRTQRLKRESRARGIIKSKEQIAEEEEIAREKALSTSMMDDAKAKKSKGLAMMAKMGFTGGGLGRKTENGAAPGRTEPIQVSVKEDRGGIGLDNEKKRKIREAAEERDIKAAKMDPDEYRERVRKEREDARLEKQFFATQRTAERMDDEKLEISGPDASASKSKDENDRPATIASRPLKSIPLLYRGLVKHREEAERDRRMRYDLGQSLPRLPTYEDDQEDADDKRALGKGHTVYATAEDLDEEDEELDRFNELDIGERLKRVLKYLRERHQYCFWCKMTYPDAEMEGCPGLTEEEHD